MEREDQRVVLRGWDARVHPSFALQFYDKAQKVEAFYRREDEKQGTVIVSFRHSAAAKAALGRADAMWRRRG